jgi:ATP-dependent Clp protease adaptor protein ClpS
LVRDTLHLKDDMAKDKSITKTETNTVTSVKENFKIQPAKRYEIVLHNNPTTHLNAVVDVLIRIYKKTEEDATKIMFTAHNSLKATVLTSISKEVGEIKMEETKTYCEKMSSGVGQLFGYEVLTFTLEEME